MQMVSGIVIFFILSGKVYISAEKEAHHLAAFVRSKEIIRKHNEAIDNIFKKSFRIGLTSLADYVSQSTKYRYLFFDIRQLGKIENFIKKNFTNT
jgi:hypothetical protein